MVGAVCHRACMYCARGVFISLRAFLLSEAGWPGCAGFAGWGRLGMRRKGLEDLNVYRHQQEQEDKVREDLNMPSSGWGALRGTGPRATVRTECLSPHRCAGACPPRSLPHPGHPANPGHPASDAINIKVLTDLFCLLRRRSIDIKVFQTFSACSCGLILNILQILTILAILTNNHLPHWWGACMRCHLRAPSNASVSTGFPTLIRICSCNPGVLK